MQIAFGFKTKNYKNGDKILFCNLKAEYEFFNKFENLDFNNVFGFGVALLPVLVQISE